MKNDDTMGPTGPDQHSGLNRNDGKHDLGPECAATAELLAAWVDGALVGEEAREVTRHVARCAACSAEADELRVILGDLHDAFAEAPTPAADDPVWATMAARIDAAVSALPQAQPAPQLTQVEQVAEVVHLAEVVQLPQRRWRSVTWALSGLAAAAVLALVAMRFVVPTGQDSGAMRPDWTDALQARMPIEDDPASGDSDPVDDLDDLDDDELEELAAQLGEEG